MKLIYYKADIGNFGDDLNKWLWPKIFGADFFKEESDSCFVGIGSILDTHSKLIKEVESYSKKYIFGSGVRNLNTNLKFDASYKSLFYRGPFSALKMEGHSENYITDGAYAIAFTELYERLMASKEKKHNISFIPYFRSEKKVDWEKICNDNGWHYISPTNQDIEQTLTDISNSKHIITEAMHGAILADVFRVPWKRIRYYAHINETEAVSEFKWNDWLSSIKINSSYHITLSHYHNTSRLKKYLSPKQIEKEKFTHIKEQVLNSFENGEYFQLSKPEVFKSVINKLKGAIKELKAIV